MRFRKHASLAVSAIVLAGLVMCQEPSGPTDEILAVEAQWVEAIRSGNSIALERLLSDDLVYTHSIGTVVTKRELIRNFKPDVQAIDYSDRKIRMFGTAAVLTAELRIRGASNGESYDNRVRLTHVWAKKGTAWQLVAHQTTFIR